MSCFSRNEKCQSTCAGFDLVTMPLPCGVVALFASTPARAHWFFSFLSKQDVRIDWPIIICLKTWRTHELTYNYYAVWVVSSFSFLVFFFKYYCYISDIYLRAVPKWLVPIEAQIWLIFLSWRSMILGLCFCNQLWNIVTFSRILDHENRTENICHCLRMMIFLHRQSEKKSCVLFFLNNRNTLSCHKLLIPNVF